MRNILKERLRKVGTEAGTLTQTSEASPQAAPVKITVMSYDDEGFTEITLERPEQCEEFKKGKGTTWINIDGVYETDIIEKIGAIFDIHPLVLEDIVTIGQRPKMVDYDNFIYVVLKMLTFNKVEKEIEAEQVSLVIGERYLITFQEKEGDVFNIIRDRIRKGKGKITNSGPDYLAYSLIDAIVDNYFIIIERVGEIMELMEDKVIADPEPPILHEIQSLKNSMMFLRKSVWPIRELINSMLRSESDIISDKVNVYLRDVYDHTIQVGDTVESYRDMLGGMFDTYLSSISNRMNNVMKVLTIIATIFIPLTFVAGVYGMNFKYMPELSWQYGYPAIWIVMIGVVISMLFYFKRKKWL